MLLPPTSQPTGVTNPAGRRPRKYPTPRLASTGSAADAKAVLRDAVVSGAGHVRTPRRGLDQVFPERQHLGAPNATAAPQGGSGTNFAHLTGRLKLRQCPEARRSAANILKIRASRPVPVTEESGVAGICLSMMTSLARPARCGIYPPLPLSAGGLLGAQMDGLLRHRVWAGALLAPAQIGRADA